MNIKDKNKLNGEYHLIYKSGKNECWIASIEYYRGCLYDKPSMYDNINEFDNKDLAIDWLKSRLTYLGQPNAAIEERQSPICEVIE